MRNTLSVAIVDDDVAFAATLAELLNTTLEFSVQGMAHSVAQGIELLESEHFDVALVDVRMPGGGGRAVREATARYAAPHDFVFISGHDVGGILGLESFVPKDELTPATLLEVLTQHDV